MPEMRYPGVYVEEVPALRPIEGVSTASAAFLGFAPAGKVGVPVEIDSWQAFCREFALDSTDPHALPMCMPHAVRGYFENGGRKAIVLRLDGACTGTCTGACTGTCTGARTGTCTGTCAEPAQYVQELAKLDSVPDVSMVVTPETQDEQVVEAVLAQVAERKQAVYLFDAPAGIGLSDLRGYAGRCNSDFGALYYPWLKVYDMAVPSAGHVAGVIARTDLKRGVYKAPAGTEAAVLGITGASGIISASERDRLREAHVNWIGSMRGSPIALQGARTMGESYLNVRRALIYLERSLATGLQQLVFERTGPTTWAKAAALAQDFLRSEHMKGGLQGRKSQEAYFVRCDATTHTSSDIERGRVLLLAGVALIRPAEFFTMQIGIQTRM